MKDERRKIKEKKQGAGKESKSEGRERKESVYRSISLRRSQSIFPKQRNNNHFSSLIYIYIYIYIYIRVAQAYRVNFHFYFFFTLTPESDEVSLKNNTQKFLP